MSAPLDDLASYSAWVYALADRQPLAIHSTLTLVPIGATLARLEGRIECSAGLHVEVWELIDFATRRIRTYSYEVCRNGEKICWYDPWEHPEIPALASTFPHHKHIPPNLREHRVPRAGNPLRLAKLGRDPGGCLPGMASECVIFLGFMELCRGRRGRRRVVAAVVWRENAEQKFSAHAGVGRHRHRMGDEWSCLRLPGRIDGDTHSIALVAAEVRRVKRKNENEQKTMREW